MNPYDEQINATVRRINNVANREYVYRVAGIVAGLTVVARAVVAVASELAYWRRQHEARTSDFPAPDETISVDRGERYSG